MSKHGVLRAEHLFAHGTLELVVDAGMHIGYVFAEVTAVPYALPTIRTILERFARGWHPCNKGERPT